MKISEQEISRLFANSYSSPSGQRGYAVVSDNKVASTGQATQVEISDQAQEVQRITQLVKQLPDVREDRVQALKAQVENGTYNVSSEDIADLIIRRALADNTAL